jgi:hypothetical protein
MRELALAGLISIVFGLGSFYATDHFGLFSIVNLIAGGGATLVALGLGARRVRFVGGPHSRPVILRGLLRIAGALLVAVLLERSADLADLRLDWTFEQRFELADATRKALAELPGPVTATLYKDDFDPRIRQTRTLLQTLAREGPVEVRETRLADVPEDEDRFGIGSSNSVVLEIGSNYETVERPTEGALFEALYRLRGAGSVRTLAFLRGEGEGDPGDGGELGFSGFAEALRLEGYALRSVVSASLDEIPDDIDGIVSIAPRRRLPDGFLEALGRYLERGGRLVAFLEPGLASGIEEVLSDFGITSPDAVLIDPASGAFGGRPRGLDPIAYNYENHALTQGLNANRMTFFSGARSFTLRKPQTGDEVRRVVLASPRSWLEEDLSVLDARKRRFEPGDARLEYHPIVVAGRYPRPAGEARIVAFGDSDFASNRYLRALYNLDLALNAVHWALERQPEITLRPKIRDTVQFPLPVESTLETLYGVGLLVPQLLLIAGGIVWLRGRSA